MLIKDRYSNIWALNYAGKLLWTVRDPGGFATAHQPYPVDIDGDGREEIMAGYALLNPDGQVRWVLENAANYAKGHLDCCRLLHRGQTARDSRLALTTCGAFALLVTDGEGTIKWQANGNHHYESLDLGSVHPERAGTHILVDLVDDNSLMLFDENGIPLLHLKTEYSRFHTLVDWDGDGHDEIVLPHSRGLFDYRGQRIGTFAMEAQPDLYGGQPPAEGEIGHIVLCGDMTGDGTPDIAITTPDKVYVFKNEKGLKAAAGTEPGCGSNFTLY